jgi:hypothetical protein
MALGGHLLLRFCAPLTDMSGGCAARADHRFQLHPHGVALLIQVAQERAQVSRTAAAQKRRCNWAVVILVVLLLHEPQGDHGIGEDAEGSGRDACALRERIQGRGSCSELLKQPDFVGDKEVFGRPKAAGDLQDRVRCDIGHRIPPFVNWSLCPSWFA